MMPRSSWPCVPGWAATHRTSLLLERPGAVLHSVESMIVDGGVSLRKSGDDRKAGTSALAAEPVVLAPTPALDVPLVNVHGTATAILSGGCFWGMQDVFHHVQGVKHAVRSTRPDAQRDRKKHAGDPRTDHATAIGGPNHANPLRFQGITPSHSRSLKQDSQMPPTVGASSPNRHHPMSIAVRDHPMRTLSRRTVVTLAVSLGLYASLTIAVPDPAAADNNNRPQLSSHARSATTQTSDATEPCILGHRFEPGPIVNGHNRQPTSAEIEARTEELWEWNRTNAGSCSTAQRSSGTTSLSSRQITSATTEG